MINRFRVVTFLVVLVLAALAQAQNFNTLLSFDGTDCAYPWYMSLIQGTDGNHSNVMTTSSSPGRERDLQSRQY